MQIVYYYDEPSKSFSKSIFLAGPSPRTPDVKSWRPEALKILEEKGYDGIVFVPESKPGENNRPHDWLRSSQWEHKNLDQADIVLFWTPRDITLTPRYINFLAEELANLSETKIAHLLAGKEPELKLPGLTTNVEFGHWANSGKAVLGRPPKAPDIEYLKFMADKFHVPTLQTLEEIINKALELIGDGASRTGGEREIPLFIWRHRAFQNWYQAHKNAGNRLDGARVEYLSRVRNKPEAIFVFAIKPNIFIASENRNKVNDPVLFRLDISSVVLYRNKEIVLVREFRSAVSNADCFVWELPGGSSPYITDPLKVAIEETKEEVGLAIEPNRLRHIGSRQMAATFATYKSHTYAAELTEQELEWLKSRKGIPHGSDYPQNPTGERAYTEVLTLREIMANNLVDWANIGMIRTVFSV